MKGNSGDIITVGDCPSSDWTVFISREINMSAVDSCETTNNTISMNNTFGIVFTAKGEA